MHTWVVVLSLLVVGCSSPSTQSTRVGTASTTLQCARDPLQRQPLRLTDADCITALAGSYVIARSTMPEAPTIGDVINVINGATGSQRAGSLLAFCTSQLTSAGQDIAALRAVVDAKARREQAKVKREGK